MLDKIMNLVKGQVTDSVGGMAGIPEDKTTAVVETTASSLISGLKEHAASGGIGSLLGIGGGSGGGNMASGLISNVVSSLTSKVGLDPSTAQKIASKAVPAVTSLLKGKVADTKEPGFNLESLVGGLTGGKSSGGGGILNAVEGLFGKK
jgi:hypothetical protein